MFDCVGAQPKSFLCRAPSYSVNCTTPARPMRIYSGGSMRTAAVYGHLYSLTSVSRWQCCGVVILPPVKRGCTRPLVTNTPALYVFLRCSNSATAV